MGKSLTVELGFGLELEELDESHFRFPGVDEESEEEFEFRVDFGKRYPLLTITTGSIDYEYITGGAIFVKRTRHNGYYASATLTVADLLTLTDEEEQQLIAAAKEFDLKYEPKVIAFPSYG